MLVGYQIKYVIDVIQAKLNPVVAGTKKISTEKRLELANGFTRMIMQLILTIIICTFSIFYIIYGNDEDMKKAAVGFIGMVIGYWLR